MKDEGYCKNFSVQTSFTFPHKLFNIHTSSLFPSGSSMKTIRSPCPALMVSTVKMAGCFTMFPCGSIPVIQAQSGTLAVANKPQKVVWRLPTHKLSNPSSHTSPQHQLPCSPTLTIKAFFKNWLNHWCSTHLRIPD